MKKFEYLTIISESVLTHVELDAYGKESWELITVLSGPSAPREYIFKREFIPTVSVGDPGWH